MQQRRHPHIDGDGGSSDDQVAQARRSDAARHENSSSVRRVTLIIPLHNEEENIKAVTTGALEALRVAGYEPSALLVDDGSTDRSLDIIKEMAAAQHGIKYISLSRNFGKEAALMAGLTECGDEFDAVAYMDSDGQHTAADLVRLVDAIRTPNTDLVCGVRTDRSYQTPRQRLMTKIFYQLFRKLSDARIDEGVGDFNVMKPKVVQALRGLREEYPFMKGLVGWVGFRRRLLPITIQERAGGAAKSSTKKMLRLAVGAILSFSSWPLRAWSAIGICSALAAVAYLGVVIVQTAIVGRNVPGYATMVVLLLGLGGLQLLSIGVVGEYVARIYDASKRRPRYIISECSEDSGAT